jgi:hypothetical protein
MNKRWRPALNSLWYPDSIKNAPTAIRFRVSARSVQPTPTNSRSIMALILFTESLDARLAAPCGTAAMPFEFQAS